MMYIRNHFDNANTHAGIRVNMLCLYSVEIKNMRRYSRRGITRDGGRKHETRWMSPKDEREEAKEKI